MIETCRDCALFFIYPSPKHDMGICEETRYIMAPEAPACNYFTPYQPTIDAVEVVRCKDCKYFDGECCDRYADETLGYSHSTQSNFFCACGERKTDV